jgi:hypothetical protein
MARAKTDPTDDLPPKTGPSGWRLIVEDLFPAWCDRLGSSEDARDETYALLCDRETRSAKYRVDASGKEIPGTFSSLGPWFWSGRLLLEPDANGGVDRLVVDYMDYVDAYSVPGERMEFLVRHLDIERWERLYPELAAPPPPPSKNPISAPASTDEISIIAADQSEERQRAARKSELVKKAIAGCFPKGIPEILPNPELIQAIMKWLANYCKENEMSLPKISDTQILRVSGRKR